MICKLLVFFASVILSISSLHAATPDDLKLWESWILSRHSTFACPMSYDNPEERVCAWPNSLVLEIESNRAQFKQFWQLYSEAWVALPGDQTLWPQSVEVNDHSSPLVELEEKPALRLVRGNYEVQGHFTWEKQPDFIQIPPNTGVVRIFKNGKEWFHPKIDEDGKLWLIEKNNMPITQNETKEQNQAEIRVFRLLEDDIPFMITTRIELDISGTPRLLELGKIVPDSFEIMSIDSPLAIKRDKSHHITLQAIPGSWKITLRARSLSNLPPNHFAFETQNKELWPNEELWAFKSNASLRNIRIENQNALDPKQTALPPEWHLFPTYRMKPDEQLNWTELSRGDAQPEANQLTLKRQMWLDFNGKGMTFSDELSGTLHQGWRLTTHPDFMLGHAQLNGIPQVITTLDEKVSPPEQGIEIRQGAFLLKAISRIEKNIYSFPATLWESNIDSLTAELNLPPGWKLFHSTGVDKAYSTWVTSWSLWEIFIVFMMTVSAWKLKGRLTGCLSFLTLLLTANTMNAPFFAWLGVLAVIALLKVLPMNPFFHFIQWAYRLSLTALLLLIIPFSVQQIRQAIYPQLEYPTNAQSWLISKPNSPAQRYPMTKANDQIVKGDEQLQRESADAMEGAVMAEMQAPTSMDQLKSLNTRAKKASKYDYDDHANNLPKTLPNAIAQTGPGIPNWQWQKIHFHWSGPVAKDQILDLWLITPMMHRVISFLSVILCFILFSRLLSKKDILIQPRPQIEKTNTPPPPLTNTVALIFMSVVIVTLCTKTAPVFAEYPSKWLIKETESKLLAAPLCMPTCGSIQKTLIELNDNTLNVTLEIHALAHIMMPLPHASHQWQILEVKENDAETDLLKKQSIENQSPKNQSLEKRQSKLRLALTPGIHHIQMKGRLTKTDQFQLTFPATPHFTQVLASKEWVTSGLEKNYAINNTVQFDRTKENAPPIKPNDPQAPVEESTFISIPMKPFAKVTRLIQLELNGYIETTIERLNTESEAMHLKLPLIAGESVLTEGVLVQNNIAEIHLAPHQESFTFRSALTVGETLKLTASPLTQWIEEWQLQISPIWHVVTAGIPPIKASEAAWMPKFKPYPGEHLTLTLSKPNPIQGNTITVDQVILDHRPGQRLSQSELNLSVRSSVGHDFPIQLPVEAEILEIAIDQQKQPLYQKGAKITLPIQPGAHQVLVKWQTTETLQMKQSIPAVSIGAPATNIHLKLHEPQGRWILFMNGPQLGPAILFWGVLILIILASVLLSRNKNIPLKWYDWLLLGVGLSTGTLAGSLVIIAWFYSLHYREKWVAHLQNSHYELMQLYFIALTMVMLVTLLIAISTGLLGQPNMGIVGNGSSYNMLNWYQDHSGEILPTAYVISLPLLSFQLFMLMWSIWLALSLTRWLKWGWACFSVGGLWKKQDAIK